LPLVVRLSLASYVFSARRAELIITVVAAALLGAGGVYFLSSPDQTIQSDRYGNVDGHLIGWISLAIALFLLSYLPFSARRQLGDGFSAGADHQGVYVRPNMDKGRVLFLPWPAIEHVRVRRWHGRQLVVKPRDASLEPQFALVSKGRMEQRAGIAIAQRRRVKKLGTNIHAPIAGQDPTELLTNLRYHAAGRTSVEVE
jgi:hypothetical protein